MKHLTLIAAFFAALMALPMTSAADIDLGGDTDGDTATCVTSLLCFCVDLTATPTCGPQGNAYAAVWGSHPTITFSYCVSSHTQYLLC